MVCLREVRNRLGDIGLRPTVAQLRWAIDSGKIPRPLLDASLRFDFTTLHMESLIDYFREKSAAKRERQMAKSQPGKAKPGKKKWAKKQVSNALAQARSELIHNRRAC